MKKIVCELCESMDFVKDGGMFICQGCGTKYTAEEAKGMMREVEGTAPAVGTPSVVPVVNPNQQQIENILILASTAYEASNLQEAENYCNKAIELDATSYKAWFLKGKAVGWSSTIGKLRIEEAAHSFCKAIDFAPEDERDSIKDEAVEEIQKLGLALMGTRKNRFVVSPQSEVDGFQSDTKTIYDALVVLLQHGNGVDVPQEYLHQICTIMYEAGAEVSRKADDAYLAKSYPEIDDFSEYGSNLLASVIVIKFSLELNDNEDDEVKLERYKKIQEIVGMPASTEPKGRFIYKKEWNSKLSKYVSHVDSSSLSVILITIGSMTNLFGDKTLKDILESLGKKVEAKKEAEKRAAEEAKKVRITAYWEAHKEEKDKLETEKKNLENKQKDINSQIAELDKQIKAAEAEEKAAVPSEAEESKLHEQVRELEARKAKLGLFAGKEKKQIAEEIAAIEGRISAVKAKVQEEKKAKSDEVKAKVAPLKTKKDELNKELPAIKKRISAIDAELSKDPEE